MKTHTIRVDETTWQALAKLGPHFRAAYGTRKSRGAAVAQLVHLHEVDMANDAFARIAARERRA